MIHSIILQLLHFQVVLSYITEFDLPQLTTLSTGYYSFHKSAYLSISGKSLIRYDIDLPQLADLSLGEQSFAQAFQLSLSSSNNSCY